MIYPPKVRTDDVNKCLHYKSGSRLVPDLIIKSGSQGVPDLILYEFMFLLFY